MSLILAIPADRGVILAADGEATLGEVRLAVGKLHRLTAACAWGAAGELALIQRFAEMVRLDGEGQDLADQRDALAATVKEAASALIRMDFRTPLVQHDPAQLAELHPGDFIFAEYSDRPRILHIPSSGAAEWLDGAYAIGNAALFAYALIKKYEGAVLTVAQASLLAYKVVEEAIEVGAYGVGRRSASGSCDLGRSSSWTSAVSRRSRGRLGGSGARRWRC